jgi:CheY-like chemotaxis protein
VDDFAVILLDVVMPGMDGFETAYHIKRKDRTRDVPIIFLTAASGEPDLAFRGYAAGAVDYLVKPLDPWVLRCKVEMLLELHRQRHRSREQAALLAGVFPGMTGPADGGRLAADLADRLTAVEEAVAELGARLEHAAARRAFDHLDHEVTGLRKAHDALFGSSQPTAAPGAA